MTKRIRDYEPEHCPDCGSANVAEEHALINRPGEVSVTCQECGYWWLEIVQVEPIIVDDPDGEEDE